MTSGPIMTKESTAISTISRTIRTMPKVLSGRAVGN